MRLILLVVTLALAAVAVPDVASAHHYCNPPGDPTVGGTWLGGDDGCVGVIVGLGPEFRCPGVRSDTGTVTIAVLASFGCATGVVVALP